MTHDGNQRESISDTERAADDLRVALIFLEKGVWNLEILKSLLKIFEISLEQLSVSTGLEIGLLEDIQSGKQPVTLEIAKKFANQFDVPMERFLPPSAEETVAIRWNLYRNIRQLEKFGTRGGIEEGDS